jgi:hypothetical protein
MADRLRALDAAGLVEGFEFMSKVYVHSNT